MTLDFPQTCCGIFIYGLGSSATLVLVPEDDDDDDDVIDRRDTRLRAGWRQWPTTDRPLAPACQQRVDQSGIRYICMCSTNERDQRDSTTGTFADKT